MKTYRFLWWIDCAPFALLLLAMGDVGLRAMEWFRVYTMMFSH
jgi:hypothetical protein